MQETPPLTPGAHRSIRLVDARECAYGGELVTDGDSRAIRVDASTVADVLWRCADAEHVAGVRDIVRTSSGQDALLPWCTERIDMFLGRRVDAEAPLATGEIVTLVGSLLRGIVEMRQLAGESDPLSGQWWLADDARPLFVPGEGSDCAESAAGLVERLREGTADRAMARALGEIGASIRDHRRVQRSIAGWEHELTELAAPRPLVREVYAPERVEALPVHRAHLPTDTAALGEPTSRARALVERLVAMLGEARNRLADRLRRPGAEQEPATRERTGGGRGRMLIVGTAVASAVVVGGLLWPSGDEDSVADERPTSQTDAPAGAAREPAQTEAPKPKKPETTKPETTKPETTKPETKKPAASQTPDAGDAGPTAQRVSALLREIAECAKRDDTVCVDAVVSGAGELVIDRLAGSDPARAVTPVEDYGDIAVLRLASSGERGEQMLVVVVQKEKWLVRDVYDVAHQPETAG